MALQMESNSSINDMIIDCNCDHDNENNNLKFTTLPCDHDDPRFIKAFLTTSEQDLNDAAHFFDTYGFVVFVAIDTSF
jgi:hypothetical protein